ncbi:MAG: CoA-binding protein [Chloroflexi bacterium]|nr:CoA-binding protein [Chloroflexota bacterium]
MSDIEEILKTCKTVAVVGLSPKVERASYGVASYLKGCGFRIIPVNPAAQEVMGEKCYPRLTDVAEPVDVVDIFRRSEDVPSVVDEAIKIGAKAVWMQLGIVNEEAAKRAREAGLKVVMDKCIKVEHGRLR